MTKGHADHTRYKGPNYVPWNVTDPLGRSWSADYDPWDGLTTVVLFGSLFIAVILCLLLKSLWRLLYTKHLRACFVRIGLMRWYWWLADKDNLDDLEMDDLANGSEQIMIADLAGNPCGENAALHSRQDSDSLAMHSLDFSSNDDGSLDRADSCLLDEAILTDFRERQARHESSTSNSCTMDADNRITVIEVDECTPSPPKGDLIIPTQI